MKKLIVLIILLSTVFQSLSSFSQNEIAIDSLKSLLRKSNNDSIQIDLLNQLSDKYLGYDYTQSENYAKRALKAAEKINDQERIIISLSKISGIYEDQNNCPKAIEYLEKVLVIQQELDNKRGMADCLYNTGLLYYSQSSYKFALQCFEEVLRLEKDLNNKEGVISSFNLIGIIYLEKGDYDKAILYFNKSLKIAEEFNDIPSISMCLNNIGLVNDYKGDIINALKYYKKSLNIDIENKNKKGIAEGKVNIGSIYQKQGNYEKAFDCFKESLLLAQEINDEYLISVSLSNIGTVHHAQGNNTKAIEYLEKALKSDEERGDKNEIAESLLYIGTIKASQEKYKEALSYIERSLQICTEIGDQSGVANAISLKGSIYYNQNDFNSALSQFKKAIKLHEQLGEEGEIAEDNVDIGEVYFKLRNYPQSEYYCLNGLEFATKTDNKSLIKTASNVLAKVYAQNKNFEKAYEYHVLYKETYDSIFTLESKKNLAAIESRYELERQEKEIEEQTTKIERQQKQQKILIGGFSIIFITVILVILSYIKIRKAKNIIAEHKEEILESNEELNQTNEELRTTLDTINKQKEEILAQNEKIEKTNIEITDSINYAKYIQNSILPHSNRRNDLLGKHFVFFKPKNIVSGDFYWLTHIEGRTVVAAADCTGHGVPGAFMSMLGMSFLNDIVNKEYITHAGVILRRLRKEIINALRQKGELGEQRDGMDISLCSIDYSTLNLQFAGANNPLYVIRSKDKKPIKEAQIIEFKDRILYEIKGDRMPIALDEKMRRFKMVEIQLLKGDTLYMFSDGFPDQFGGEKGKKFMFKQFKELLLSNCDKPVNTQQAILNQTLRSWKGSYEQVDDILVIGIQI